MGVVAVATDFSALADRAVRRAAILAQDTGDELLVLHVLEESGPSDSPGAHSGEAEDKLSEIAQSLRDADGLRTIVDIRTGRVSRQICEAAAAASARLIVIGRHRGVLRDMVQATTGETLVRQCSVPILTANSPASARYRKILLATDLSEENLRCVERFWDLSLIPVCQLIVLHIFDAEAFTMLGRTFVPGDEREAYMESRDEEAEAQLCDWLEKSGLQGAEVQVRPSVGSTPDDLVAAAHKQSVDLIMVCKSRGGAVKRAVVGSITSALLRGADVEADVLVIPMRSSRLAAAAPEPAL